GRGRRLTVQAPENMLTTYSKKARLRTVNPHSFRHAKARRIIERGGSNSDVMNILGHSSLASSEIYTTLYGKRLSERAEKFL
ncbi:MAG: tyrosine-type recombinase/integrase, partial [Undibacterium sp.]